MLTGKQMSNYERSKVRALCAGELNLIIYKYDTYKFPERENSYIVEFLDNFALESKLKDIISAQGVITRVYKGVNPDKCRKAIYDAKYGLFSGEFLDALDKRLISKT